MSNTTVPANRETNWNDVHLRCTFQTMTCKPCSHPQRNLIDQQIIAAVPFRTIAASFNLSLGSISRHRVHIRQALGDALRARESEEKERDRDLLNRVERLVGECEEILATAKSEKDLRAATSAIGAATRLLELIGRLSGELTSQNAGGIHVTLNKVTNTTINTYGDDTEVAMLIAEATDQFNPAIIERYKLLAAGQPTEQ